MSSDIDNPKPCPFCGEDAEVTTGYVNDLVFARVDCTECTASCYMDSDHYPELSLDEMEAQVVADWNRRADKKENAQ